MPAPTTIDEFLELVRKSGVVDEKRLTTHLDKLRAGGQSLTPDPVRLATQLVKDGILTHFQAEQFLQGKWRRFTIGKYKVLERLGAGGMGSVYLCEHMLMRRRVAVKVLPAAKAEDSSSLERFYREARAVAALDHPNIVRAYDIDQDENLHFLVMEHVDGSSLQEIIKRTGGMDVLRAAHYTRQAALGLQHAHETAGLVHRDIKPGNILVDRNGIVKILDMGLARFFHDDEDILTKKYDENVLGTADYLAPEQALDSHSVDHRADIYSLGATFYFCLTGRTPFAEGTVAQKLIWHQTRAPKAIRSFRPDVPEGIIAVIDRMMAKDVNQRYQKPQDVADALEPWTRTPIPPPPDNEMPQFSLAASRAATEVGGQSTTKAVTENSPGPRKGWQAGTAAQATATVPMTAPTTRPVAPASPGPGGQAVVAPVPVQAGQSMSVSTSVVRAPGPRAATPAPPVSAPAPVATPRAEARVATPMPQGGSSVLQPPTSQASNGSGSGQIQENTSAPRNSPWPQRLEDLNNDEAELDEEVSGLPSRGGSSRRRRKVSSDKRPMWVWIVVGASVLVGLPLLGVILSLLLRPSKKPSVPPPDRPPIRVGPNLPGGLAAALQRAKAKDIIHLEQDITECDLTVATPNLTIMAAPGKKITWKCPKTATAKTTKLLIIQGVPGVTVRDITMSGEDRTESLITIYGKCPGTTLENLQLEKTREFGIMFANCEGDQDNPVRLFKLDFLTTRGTAAIRFNILPHHKTIRVNKYISLDNCQFQGDGEKLTTSNQAFVDNGTVTLPQDLKVVVKP
jgi:serine/threonine protein kinase